MARLILFLIEISPKTLGPQEVRLFVNMPHAIRPVVLCILDGWGQRTDRENNAILQANTPVWDRLNAGCPTTYLQASEHYVGLPEGQMGNSEVGHMNLGAGRVVLQDLPKINEAINDGTLATNANLGKMIDALKISNGTAHIVGLMSPGGVHSHQDHMAALANILDAHDIPVLVHAILDGRDTPPKSAGSYLQDFMNAAPKAKIATVVGRYWAMDRDNNWDRVEKAYLAMADAKGSVSIDPLTALKAAYDRDEVDEFVEPAIINGYTGMQDGDGLIMANFRADRAREILTSFVDPSFDRFSRRKTINFAAKLGMVEFSKALNEHLALIFPSEKLENVLGDVVSSLGKKQLRIAETEKYAHVTFFFNGGEEDVFDGEDRILIPSPKVATYDLQPEMSAPEVADRLVGAIESEKYDLIVVNFANTDMVGHTGILSAAIQAVEAVDHCLGKLVGAVEKAGGAMLVTADHGNAELMQDPASGQSHTAHTLNPVPLVLVTKSEFATRPLKSGTLADVAPTLLDLMGISKPAQMTGQSLLMPESISVAI